MQTHAISVASMGAIHGQGACIQGAPPKHKHAVSVSSMEATNNNGLCAGIQGAPPTQQRTVSVASMEATLGLCAGTRAQAGCTTKATARGLCTKHGGDTRPRCRHPACTTRAKTRSLCTKHGGQGAPSKQMHAISVSSMGTILGLGAKTQNSESTNPFNPGPQLGKDAEQ
jgi:hypothetical protein